MTCHIDVMSLDCVRIVNNRLSFYFIFLCFYFYFPLLVLFSFILDMDKSVIVIQVTKHDGGVTPVTWL